MLYLDEAMTDTLSAMLLDIHLKPAVESVALLALGPLPGLVNQDTRRQAIQQLSGGTREAQDALTESLTPRQLDLALELMAPEIELSHDAFQAALQDLSNNAPLLA